MPNGLQTMLLAGLLVAVGLVSLVWVLLPAQPDAAAVVARLSGPRPIRTVAPAQPARDVHERLGLVALRLLPPLVWVATPTRELALLRKSTARFYGEKVIFAVVPLVTVPLIASMVALVAPVPWPIPAGASLLLAAGMWMLPHLFVLEDAREARAAFSRALGAYFDLVAMERANGAGPRQAMESAARLGDTWVFERIGEELARSRWSGQAPWDALHVLATDLGLPELDDLADIMRLSGEGGAQVYQSLRARAVALRNAMLTAEQARANEANEAMTFPASLLGMIFLVIILGPALLRLFS